MTRSRTFSYGAGIVAAVVVLLLGWFLAIGPQLSAAGTARSEADDVVVANALAQTRIDRLAAVPAGPLRSQLQAAVAGLPYDAALPSFTRQLTQQADQYHISLTSLSVGTPSTVAGTAATPTGADATSGAPPSTAGTLQQIPITLVTAGPGDDQRAFLRALQVRGPRRSLVTATSLAPDGSDDGTIAGRSLMTTTLTIFSAPLTSDQQTQLVRLLDGSGSS